MAVVTPPPFLDVDSVYGADDLGVPYRDLIGEGVMGYEDLRVRQRGAGANMSVDVGSGTAWIMGDESLQQPRYRVYNDATVNVAVTAAHGTNPRIDMVIAEVRDATFSGAFNDWRLRMVDGTATGGATLDNRTGAAALPNNSILLADVLVPASDSTVNDAEIRDRRPFALTGVVPPVKTRVDAVVLNPHEAIACASVTNCALDSTLDTFQTAIAVTLRRGIVGATRMRWRYRQSAATALTGNYVFGLFDASGRRIVDTGSVAFTGAVTTHQLRSETISATTLEAGCYYLFFAADTTNAGAIAFPGVLVEHNGLTGPGNAGPGAPNAALISTTGGLTVPTTILGFNDDNINVADTARQNVPAVTLSVG